MSGKIGQSTPGIYEGNGKAYNLEWLPSERRGVRAEKDGRGKHSCPVSGILTTTEWLDCDAAWSSLCQANPKRCGAFFVTSTPCDGRSTAGALRALAAPFGYGDGWLDSGGMGATSQHFWRHTGTSKGLNASGNPRTH
eukprot:1155975-Pelagomonas_calceolata.AAC.1